MLAGFLVGFPPAMVAAVGAAVLLLHPRYQSKHVYAEIDWSLLVFFVGLFLIVGGAEQSGIAQQYISLAETLNLHNRWIFSGVVVLLSNIVSNVPAVMLLKGLLPNFADAPSFLAALGYDKHAGGKFYNHGLGRQHHSDRKSANESPVSFREYLRAGIPITIATIIVGTVWLTHF